MKKLLTVCVPTYKRPLTLRRCIDSIASQIEMYTLSERVGIYVTNDFSPDNSTDVLKSYDSLDYFEGVTRDHNLGMNQNINHMLQEAALFSEYQLIITDDDFLQPEVLDEIVQFLSGQQRVSNQAPVIWTPRYSYTENGDLNCIVCNPFKKSRQVNSSAANTGRFMHNGFVLSGLILRAECIDFEFWQDYRSNAYFPVIFMGDLIYRLGAYYWAKNIVHHTVLNECHWESWGKNDFYIEVRLFTDYVNAYGVIAGIIKTTPQQLLFHIFSYPSIYAALNRFLLNEKWLANEELFSEAVREFHVQESPEFQLKLRITMLSSLILCVSLLLLKRILRAITSLRGQRDKTSMQSPSGKSKFWIELQAALNIFKFILVSKQK